MELNLTQKLISDHLVASKTPPPAGEEIAIRIDQTLTQDATGTMVMLELEALGLDRAKTECSVQYVDHNLIQSDSRNPDDHEFLRSAAGRWGLWFSPPGNGVSHPVHQQRFGKPGKTLLGSDSHTPAAGALGMLAIGAGGLEVAMAISGHPFHVRMPEVWGIELTGELSPWVSAKDVILTLLGRHGVRGGLGRVLEYYGPGLASLSAMDRHVIANMGAELGATTSVFPADARVEDFLAEQGRREDYVRLEADAGCRYEHHETIDLCAIVPMIAMPSSPGNVVTVEDAEGQTIYQAYIGSSANPGFRDFAISGHIVRGRRIAEGVSFDINPTSRQVLLDLMHSGHLQALVEAGARLHQVGCNGCIGMGQAPATDQFSVRTVPRNFPGRSGTPEDKVCLVSPETAAVSALRGAITDPRRIAAECHDPGSLSPPARSGLVVRGNLLPPPNAEEGSSIALVKGPNISTLPRFEGLPDPLRVEILLKVDDDVSTDEIMPAGTRVLPFRSNIEKISDFVFEAIDPEYVQRARQQRDHGGVHAIVAGTNYGQGSSREHAALAPRHLGLRWVLASRFARIHRSNLIDFGILPVLIDAGTREQLQVGDVLELREVRETLATSKTLSVHHVTHDRTFEVQHDLNPREVELILAGGLLGAERLHPPAA